jgi:hypothetical protein
MGSLRKKLWPNYMHRVRKTEKSIGIAGVQTRVLIGQLQMQASSIFKQPALVPDKSMFFGRGTSAVVVDDFQFVWLKQEMKKVTK